MRLNVTRRSWNFLLFPVVVIGFITCFGQAGYAQSVKRIKLTAENPSSTSRQAWPITQGIPFADGELERGAAVRVVDSDGRSLHTQSTTWATWNKDLKYVKWLLVDFQADLPAGKTKELFLEYGKGLESPKPAQPVAVTREEKLITIDTGALRLEIRPDSPDFLAACMVKTKDAWRDIFRGKPGPYLYMIGGDGAVYDSYRAAPRPTVTVEDQGPLRACVSVKGYHASAAGLRLCPYTLRIHAYAGKNELRLSHTFVFDQNPDVLEFREVGINLPLDLGGDLRMAVGGQKQSHWAQRWQRGEFLQSSDIDYQVTRDGEVFGKGEKTRGWASLSGTRGSALVAIRDFWQQFPKGYELTPEGIKVQFWPASFKQNLVFSTPWKERPVYFNGYYGDPPATAASRDEATVKLLLEKYPTAPLNLKSFLPKTTEDLIWIESMVDKYAPNRPASHNDTGTEDGTGAAKTHEVVLRFGPEPISDEQSEVLATQVQDHVIAPADPAYMGKTRAARDMFGGPDPRFAELDALLDGVTEKVAIEPMYRSRLWGFWRFGYMVCSHAAGPGLAYQVHYATDPLKALRHAGPYNNEDDDPIWGLWTQFLRTGNRRFFLAASGFSRATGDVGITHAHPSKPEVVGLMHYHGGHQWIGSHSPSHTISTSLFLHYYLTGDRRMHEIGLEVADKAVRNQEKAGIVSNRNKRLNREFATPLLCLMEAYVDTWDRKYEDLARRSLNWFLRTQSKPAVFPMSTFTRGERGDEIVVESYQEAPVNLSAMVYPLFYEGLRHFDSPLLRQTVLAAADSVVTLGDLGDHRATFLSLAYELTGKPIYAAYCKQLVDEYKSYAQSTIDLKNIAFFSGIRNGHIAVLKATAARAMDKDPKGFAEAEKQLKQLVGSVKRTPWKPLPNTPQEQSLGVPEGYDNLCSVPCNAKSHTEK